MYFGLSRLQEPRPNAEGKGVDTAKLRVWVWASEGHLGAGEAEAINRDDLV